jgi:ABC-type polysaccharide/polyol phosphate export permease
MFQRRHSQSSISSAAALLALIYHATVRNVRKTSGNAVLGLLSNMTQAVVMVAAFYVMFTVLGLKGTKLRGDFLLYLMSGIFLFLTHNKTMGAVLGSEGPTSAMMKHAPMNTVVTITAAALSTLYLQVLALGTVLFGVHVILRPIEIDDPAGLMGNFLLAWLSGAAVGMLFLAMKPWAPGAVSLMSMIYARVNMIASGKLFVANMMPTFILAYFTWNPLFHTIDQARGATFINYSPRYTDPLYPLWVSLALLMIGLMGEFYTRRAASLSWDAAR